MIRWPLFAVVLLLASCMMAKSACVELDDEDVHFVPEGYVILSLLEYFPAENTNRSGDDSFWLCQAEGGDLALFVPPVPTDDEDDE